ncbi:MULTISPECIES: class I SAM-dependent methyltransferase [Kitasatospora]|uniref:Putative methyltransferase n=1 Tax=Kitasatospora setae (strain ATCC 33774 / DSM 43861 / JCM 3304 / KCC A-0304 / NBRC 14216 / KM-6054) TaxID=452652 RepID=E4MZ17_KITSK|nr:class I SAM-dependent methyltransferase [Kitasatospora setae]BAJ25910.1 putative methyltransferase [Kitasatospora setae KM-6054]BAJ33368.1 putative methyltransferase [Kitasatospora setae KM-6054]
MLTEDHRAWGHTASTGLGFTHHAIVDTHFRACRDPYLDLLRQAGLQPGWHVLDAGCGPGDFLPAIAGHIGPRGRITALDLAPENAALAAERVSAAPPGCPVDVRQGSVTDLPHPDDTFDAVWCSNTVQYLDDTQLDRFLAEAIRVTRPGGLLAIKDLDAHLITLRPGDPYLFQDFFRTAGRTPGYARQLLRSRELYRRMRRAGLTDVRQRTVLIEHHAPLSPDALDFYTQACDRLARQAEQLGLSQEWQRLRHDKDSPQHPLNHPDGYISEGNVLALATVPPAP